MKHLRTAFALGFAAMLPLSPLAAETPFASDRFQAAAHDPGTIASRSGVAESLRMEGKLDASLREYQAIVAIQKDFAIDATETLWTIAEIQFARGDRLRTARALDAVAEEAAKYGHLDRQARALFESAMTYASINQHGQANDRMARLRPLLATDAISPELRERIEQRTGRR